MQADQVIAEICITGGPAAGKTSAIEEVQSRLWDAGWRAFALPEAATLAFNAGLSDLGQLSAEDPQVSDLMQGQLIAMMVDLRHRFRTISHFLGEDSILLFDRGEMDGKAYMSEQGFLEHYRARRGKNWEKARDSYPLVVHLESVACLDEELYDKATNPARREDADRAILADQRTWEAWDGHPRRLRVPAQRTFSEKVALLEGIVLEEIKRLGLSKSPRLG